MKRFRKGCWGRGFKCRPLLQPLLLLEDARTLLQKRNLCPKKLCHLRGSPQNSRSNMGSVRCYVPPLNKITALGAGCHYVAISLLRTFASASRHAAGCWRMAARAWRRDASAGDCAEAADFSTSGAICFSLAILLLRRCALSALWMA